MLNILAIDTATDACSVTLRCDGELVHRYELIPRQHSGRIFSMTREVLPGGEWPDSSIDLLAYTHGPGSFTGLRIAASAVQGLAYANAIPVAGISTLACLAQGCWRRGAIEKDALALVLLDARINELYWGLYEFVDGRAKALCDDAVSAPSDLPPDIVQAERPVIAVGSGLCMLQELPAELTDRLSGTVADQWPDSRDLLELCDGLETFQSAAEVQPVYLRNEIQWKKLSEQG